jgi:antitoxin (DNA-binding transcriptional repressor) of toxin-antitoxin stability system
MKTLSVTAGRSKLGHWLKRAIAGDDIGIVVDGVVVGLRPVTVISEDYALREYGVTQDEADAAAARISKDIAVARKRGQVKRFSGNLNDLRG